MQGQHNANAMPPVQIHMQENFLNIFDAHRQGKQIKNKQQQSTFDAAPTQQRNANATPPFFNFMMRTYQQGKQIKNRQQQ